MPGFNMINMVILGELLNCGIVVLEDTEWNGHEPLGVACWGHVDGRVEHQERWVV